MEKINTISKDLKEENLEKLREIFPNVFAEDKLDIEKLKNFLGDKIIDENIIEKYGLNWAGKSQAFKAIRVPSTGTLVRDNKGVAEDDSENVFIEGDNLEVLKLLQKHYYNQIKMIYIDPPYNTGKDFVYKDNWTDDIESYYKLTGQTDEHGIKMTANTEKNGRFHSDWLTMMYPRLFLARNLLKDDGVIFVSIDDNEVANLRLIMDEIFGEENFIGNFIWNKKNVVQNDADFISVNHEYIVCYGKSIEELEFNLIPRTEEQLFRYKNPDNDPKGPWVSVALQAKSGSSTYEIEFDNGVFWKPVKGTYPRLSKESLLNAYKDNRLWFGESGNNVPRLKKYLSEVQNGVISNTILLPEDVGSTQLAKETLKKLLDSNVFDTPKPIGLLSKFITLSTDNKNDDIILDFFAGSGTTAHAVMDLNAKDGGNRRWICVQIPELTDEKSEAYKADYKTISEISRERIKRAGEKIKKEIEESEDLLMKNKALGEGKKKEIPILHKSDLGFKTFSLENSNYRMWNVLGSEDTKENLLKQAKLFTEKPLVDSYKEIDVVNEVLLKEGFDLNSKVEEKDGLYVVSEKVEDEEKRIFISFAKKVLEKDVEKLKLNENDTFVCFDSALTDTDKTNISRQKFNLKVI